LFYEATPTAFKKKTDYCRLLRHSASQAAIEKHAPGGVHFFVCPEIVCCKVRFERAGGLGSALRGAAWRIAWREPKNPRIEYRPTILPVLLIWK